jgi:hypothetical protein
LFFRYSRSNVDVVLVERKGVLQVDRTFDHKVSTVPSNASVSNEPKDTRVVRVVVIDYLLLFALEYTDTRVVGLNVNDEVVELAYRPFSKLRTVLFCLCAIV